MVAMKYPQQMAQKDLRSIDDPVFDATRHRLYTLASKYDSDVNPETLTEIRATINEYGEKIYIGSIIDDLIRKCFNEENLLQEEFVDWFVRHKIADMLVVHFVARLPRSEAHNDEEDPHYRSAKESLRSFLENFATSSRSLHSFIESRRKRFKDINYFQIFLDPEVRGLLHDQINDIAAHRAEAQFDVFFKENPTNFILSYVFNRVFTLKSDGNIEVDDEALHNLVAFLDKHKFHLEQLYYLIFEELVKMRALKDSVGGISDEVVELVYANEILDGSRLLRDDFDFDRIWKDHFRPAIVDVRREKVGVEKYRTVDVSTVDIGSLAEVHLPVESLDPVKNLLQLVKGDDKEFMYQLRKYFNYLMHEESTGKTKVEKEAGPEGLVGWVRKQVKGKIFKILRRRKLDQDDERELKIAALTDKQILNILGEQMDHVADFITYITEEGLERRDADDPIRQNCRVMPELLGCRDMRKLLTWIAEPQSFIDEFPQYSHVKRSVISHFARKMWEFLLLYRKYAFKQVFMEAQKRRGSLEDFFCKSLNIRETRQVVKKYQVVTEIDDPATAEPITYPLDPGKVVSGPNCKNNCKIKTTPHYRILNEDEIDPDKVDGGKEYDPETGKWYQYYPTEERKFLEAKVTIPNGKKGKFVEGKILIYSGDGDIVHCKSLESYLSSILRKKTPSDLLRMTFVTDDPEVRQALMDYMYDNYYSSGNYDKLEHVQEGRFLCSKYEDKVVVKNGNAAYYGGRDFSGAPYATVAVVSDDGEIEHTHLGFETHIMTMDSLLISSSDHTSISHGKVYTPGREFNNMFTYLFPPALFGKQFAEYKMQGFKGRNGFNILTARDEEDEDEEEVFL